MNESQLWVLRNETKDAKMRQILLICLFWSFLHLQLNYVAKSAKGHSA